MTTVLLGLTGDVMLGRLIDQDLADPRTVPAEIWGDLLPVFAAVDIRLINLECVIATAGQPDPERVFHFRARPRALEVLRAAHVDFVGLANNHVLDYGQDASRSDPRSTGAAGERTGCRLAVRPAAGSECPLRHGGIPRKYCAEGGSRPGCRRRSGRAFLRDIEIPTRWSAACCRRLSFCLR